MSPPQRVKALKPSSPFLKLSSDLVQNVLRRLDKSRDISSVCLCSRTLLGAGERVLYEAPVATTFKNTEKLLKTLIDKPKLALWVDDILLKASGMKPSPLFLELCAKAIRLMHNITKLNVTSLPDVPALLGAHVLPNLTQCCISDRKSALPFLEANASTIEVLLLADNDKGPRGIDRKIELPRLKRADLPLSSAPFVLPGTQATTVDLSVTSDPDKRPAELKNFAFLAGVPITSLTITSERLTSDVIPPLARYTFRELQQLIFETTRPHTAAQRKRFFDTLEIQIALMRKVRTIMVPVPPGQARFPEPKDLDEMAAICERLSKRCPSLKLVSPGFNLQWKPYDGLWVPLTPAVDYDRYVDLIGLWTFKRMARNPSMLNAMLQEAKREDPTRVREFEESRGIKMRPLNVLRRAAEARILSTDWIEQIAT
ncbi:uncharacterized protein SCHCODRAFT_02570748 [Schizophyllum commune H4-8]|uniref:uncharacterized protein n=1 Tax=Schizophyllum commune (strain H4-8 / FGSC 9210) TaxID=578458 RepID=UPI00215F4019|nr:uncharacterized protein SCHCODRAFT_02570748 [Schizophyllum commune H4-8]KAI5897170.1 hypothetical protein SCHCODRAFT_02570748 [Schizophyllum commune H4-8]